MRRRVRASGLAARAHRPEWEGRVGWSPASDSLQQYVTALRLEYGDDVAREWLEGMVANQTVDFPDNVSIRDAIAAGEIDVGLINHYYVAQAIAAEGDDYPVKLFYPPDGLGSLLLLTSVGVLESSRAQGGGVRLRPLAALARGPGVLHLELEGVPARRVDAKLDPSLELPLDRDPAPPGDLSDIAETQATIELMQDGGAL